jgi:hypothetical protein
MQENSFLISCFLYLTFPVSTSKNIEIFGIKKTGGLLPVRRFA